MPVRSVQVSDTLSAFMARAVVLENAAKFRRQGAERATSRSRQEDEQGDARRPRRET